MLDKNNIEEHLVQLTQKQWLVTGVAGFIGANLVIKLLLCGQKVTGLDNFLTGHRHNLDRIRNRVGSEAWANFTFIEGDIRDVAVCEQACRGVNYVLHQAALGSVPRSIENPADSNAVNVSGFLNMLNAAKNEQVESFVYASSSSVYGDIEDSPKVEERTGAVLSPYAVTKAVNELYAGVFSKNYDFHSVGLRYFNVFGEGQDPDGAYAAVIPKWVASMVAGDEVFINGDGSTSRDFCYIENVVEANIRAATTSFSENKVFNVALAGNTNLNDLFYAIRGRLNDLGVEYSSEPTYREFRKGDVKHSLANIDKIKSELGYNGNYSIEEGLEFTMPWYVKSLQS